MCIHGVEECSALLLWCSCFLFSGCTCQLCVNKQSRWETPGKWSIFTTSKKKKNLEILAAVGFVSHWFPGLEIVGY